MANIQDICLEVYRASPQIDIADVDISLQFVHNSIEIEFETKSIEFAFDDMSVDIEVIS